MNKDLNEVLNYMKQYVENIYEHDSEPMLNWKDLKLVLDEIERLKSIIKEVREYCNNDNNFEIITDFDTFENHNEIGIDILEILDKVDKGEIK